MIADEPPREIRWYGRDDTLSVGGFRIREPYVYTSTGRRTRTQWAVDPSQIALDAEVRKPAKPVAEMGYWPWYSRIEPEHRYMYLEWLAGGKATLPPLEGLLFLYFYGLERRLLIDQQDKEWTIREIARLRALDAPRIGSREGRSFRNYSTGLLWFAVARWPESFSDRAINTVCELTESWNDGMIAVPLFWFARESRPLSANIAVHVARLNPLSIQSVVTKRIGDQFGELFRKRYTETYGTGLILKVSKRSRKYMYRPANNGLSEATCTIADPSGIPRQFGPLAQLWNGCVDDLRRLARVTASVGGKLTVNAWEAMPPELRDGVDHPLAADMQQIVAALRESEQVDFAQASLGEASAFATILGIAPRPKLTLAQSRNMAETIQHAGYAIEPDARITARHYNWQEAVAVFQPNTDTVTDAARYLAATCMLRLGLTVAEADGVVDHEEVRRLTEQIDAVFQLSTHEKQRLEALRAVLLKAGADLGAISKRIESAIAPEARQQVGRLLVAIAAACGEIDRDEQAALRKCFRALALPPELLEETIKKIAPMAADGLVTVEAARAGMPGEQIPTHGEFQLNREAISAIIAETREVATLLASAMVEDAELDTLICASERIAAAPRTLVAADENRSTSSASKPADRYALFLAALRRKPSWTRDQAQTLAREHNLMLDGAIEAINGWAIDNAGKPCIEETDGILTVEHSLD